MVARLLNTMGVYFAPEGVSTGANEENPKGFWERRDVRALNDQLLHSAGADWHRLGDFSLQAIPELTLASFRKEAAKIILSMDAHRPWFLKEPRLCVLAPLWLELLEFPVCVFVHRSPLEVADSLKTRNDFPSDFSLALWEFYNTTALNATVGLRRVQVNHHDIMRDPVGSVRILGEALERHGVRGLRSPSEEEVLAFVDPSLARAKAAREDDALTPAQRKLWEAFETGEALRFTEPIDCSEETRNVLRARDRAVDPENKIGRLEAENARLRVELMTAKDASKEKAQEDIARLRHELSAAKETKTDLEKALAAKNDNLKKTRHKLEIAEIEIQATRHLGESLRRQMNSLQRSLTREIERLRQASKADATNAEIKQLRQAIARRDSHIQEITKSVREKAHDFATEKEKVGKLRQLLKKAATEIDRIHQSSRWKAGCVILFRPDKYKSSESFERYVGAFESWLSETEKVWNKKRAEITGAGAPTAKVAPRLPDLRFREFDHQSIDRITQQLGAPVSIVVPVYNGATDVDRCVESILRCTDVPFELILVDDCSSDAATVALLSKYETHGAVRVLRQTENRGFVRSANAGMQATAHDVVLLNSDTEVTSRWLQKLTVAAYSDPRIATVTPLSNAAGAFSVPQIGVNAPIPFPFTPVKMSRLTERLSTQAYPEVPTGNGFCMFIKREVLDKIGEFDEENFGRGYGEENDFCMRARKAGWRHVIDDSLFIYHRGNSSFGAEKQALVVQNRKTLDRIHPDYSELVREFTGSAEINAIRSRIGNALQYGEPELQLEKRRVLYILHHGSGGVPMTNADLVAKTSNAHQCFMLTSTGAEMILSEWREDRVLERKRWKFPDRWSAENFTQPAMRAIYFQVLVGLGIDLVHIRHLFKHSFDAPLLCRALGIPVVLSFHDYYFVCPSIHLLDQNAKFCGGQCTPGLQQCTIPSPMLDNLPMLKGFIPQWRTQVGRVFDCCDAFVTTAVSVRDVHVSAFPRLKEKAFWVVEHGRDLKRVTGVAAPPHPGQPIRILVAGNIDFHKGSGFIRQLKELDSEERLEFHFLGKTDETLRDIGLHHGAYKRDDFEKLARDIQPSFAAIFSISGETFSHTLTEAWAVGLPVLGSKLGAVGERIAKHGGGWIVDTADPAGTLEQIRAIANGNGVYQEALGAVEKIEFQTVEGMADAYRALYEHVLARRTTGAPGVGCLVPPGDRGSTFMRVNLPLAHEKMQERLLAVRLPAVDAHNSLGKWIDRLGLRTVFLQREALHEETAMAVIETCRAGKVRVVFEIDDNLLDVPDSHADYAFYESKIETIRYLARNADQVVVSTPKLLEIFRPLNERICVIGNAIDEWLWFSPQPTPERKPPDHAVVVGYMGTKTHRADLEMIGEPFLRARRRLESERNLRLELQIVGGLEDEPVADRWYQRLEVPQGCAAYPRFVRWLRQNAAWDFALAPLLDEPLNQSKSALKFFEYSGLGVPGIFSGVGEYPAIIENRETGLLTASNDAEEWENLIFELAVSPSLRQTLAANARRKTQEHFTLEKTIPAWLTLLRNDSFASRL
jgi:GT2 family glycosyltransferase/glycosyltransferase involved in cell wall biosynthesis